METGFLTILLAPSRLFRRAIFGKESVKWLPCDNVNLFLIRWLAFRLMFASGVVKLTSECPTWWGLTGKEDSFILGLTYTKVFSALHYHWESQCIPTWPAWYAHDWTLEWFKKLSVVATYVIEIFIPVAYFLAPVRRLRQVAFWSQVSALSFSVGTYPFQPIRSFQVLLMVNIAITGNYNFFNALTIFICGSLLIHMDGYSQFGKPKFCCSCRERL